MKHTLLSVATLALFCSAAFVGCQKDAEEVAEPAKHYSTIITVKSDSSNSKTHYDPSNGAVIWDAGDKISVARGNVFATEPFELIRDENGVATFGGDLEDATGDNYYAIYPAQSDLSIDNGRLSCVAIQSQQALTERSFGQGNNTAVGYAASTTMMLRNVGGLAKIAIRGKVAVKSIRITDNTGQKLSGRGTIDIMKDNPDIAWDYSNSQNYVEAVVPSSAISVDGGKIFYIVLPPCTLSDYDIDITLADNYVHHKHFTTSTVISRAAVTMLGAFEEIDHSTDQTFTVNGVSFTMAYVESGTFTMGATPEQESEAFDNEKPVHNVTLTQSYYICQTEVTQALWKAVMGSGNNPSKHIGDEFPVEFVSWNDVQNFITELNRLTGRTFQLPTEAQWEYAARGGKKSRGYKYSGSNTIDEVAWHYDNSNNQSHAVGSKAPNELGIYDMSGNVEEWCLDGRRVYTTSPQTNPEGPSDGFYVMRGGSIITPPEYCRVSHRLIAQPDNSYYHLGFRLVLVQ